MKIILGSESPRRKEIMQFLHVPFIVRPSSFEEPQPDPDLKDPSQYAIEMAIAKAKNIEAEKDQIILTADTIVVCKNRIFTKPQSEKEAFSMLHALMGTYHQVFTGVCARKNDQIYFYAEETKIWFHTLSEKQIRKYHQHFYFLDKAGGYSIQDGGSIIVEKIEGCFYNIMGLPINTTCKLLKNAGVDIWDYL